MSSAAAGNDVSREGGNGTSPERMEIGNKSVEAEEVLSYWFPEDLVDDDLETLRRHGKRWMAVPLPTGRARLRYDDGHDHQSLQPQKSLVQATTEAYQVAANPLPRPPAHLCHAVALEGC